MTAIQDARSVLADAEKSLRDIMQRELKAQRYSELAELAGMADGLAQLAKGRLKEPVRPRSVQPSMAKDQSVRPQKQPAKNKSTAKRAYPRFERDGDKLVKVGWSKKAREEYEHRAPRNAVLAVSQHLSEKTSFGGVFVVDNLIPVYDSAGQELPSYQVYLSLAWLRQAGAIEKRGRDGYVRVSDPLDGSLFDTLWDQIPERL